MTAGTEADDAATAANTNTGATDGESRLSPLNNDNIGTQDPVSKQFVLVENLLSSEGTIKTLADMLLDPRLKPPFTVGVYGDWGTGKSYFLESIKGTIDTRDVSGPKPLTVKFEAWQHQDDENILISMLQCAHEALPKKVRDSKEFKHRFQVVMMTIINSLPEVTLGFDKVLSLKMEPGKIAEKFKELNATYKRKKFLEKQGQVKLQESFHEAIDKLAEYDDSGNLISSDKTKRRVVFFIDDLDRCLPEKVVNILEKIKLFLWHPNCVFVIGIDQTQVKTAVRAHKNYNNDDTAQRYLEKIINFPFRMPPVNDESYKRFINDKLEAYPDKDKVVKIFTTASDERQASLRLIMQLCNGFILNDYLVSAAMTPTGQTYKPQIMAVFTALQVMYEDVFSKLCGGLDGRKSRLQALFKADTEESGPDLVTILGSDRISKIEKLRIAACNVDIGNDDLSCYVEFLMSHSDMSQYKSYYQERVEWFEKGPAAQDEESLETIVSGIKSGDIQKGQSVTIDGYRWRLLAVEGDKSKALLITEDIIGYAPLDNPENWDTYKYSWTRCALNRELNSESCLKKHLPLLSKSGRLSVSMAEDGRLGKIFLLSAEEAKRYFSSDADRISSRLGGKADRWWWLRSPGYNARYAASVNYDGSVDAYGNYVDIGDNGVRPALWLNL